VGTRALLLVAALTVTAAGARDAFAQVGIAGRIGTLGIGAEAAVDLSGRLALRGGFGAGVLLQTFTPATSFDDIDVSLEMPDSWYNVGLDYYLNSAIRIGGGVVFVTEDPVLTGDFGETVEIGGTTLTASEVGTLKGTVGTNRQAAYALIGFGRHSAQGLGLSLDVGAAILGGDPSIELSASGGSYPQAELAELLAIEARRFEDDIKTYLKVWPILSLGVRYGV
jgi:hypothetical protein